MTNTPLVSLYENRQARLSSILQAAGVDALVLNPGPSMTYLTGLNFHLMERPVVVIFRSNLPPALVLPGLEVGEKKIKETGTGLDGGPASLESKLYEDSLELGLTWRF